MSRLTATTVWRVSPELVRALDERLGPPDDSYVNGTQLWLLDTLDATPTLEWQLHPAPGYRTPKGLSPYEVWDAVTGALATGTHASGIRLGEEQRGVDGLWDGLECYPPFGDDLEPATLTGAVTEHLGVAPDAAGLVDHDAIGRAVERDQRGISITEMLLEQLGSRA